MEFKTYFAIIKKHWKIAVLALVATTALTVVMTSRQEPVYESTGTYVVRPRPVADGDAVRAIDTLVRGVEINSTYASIASSDLIKARARDRVGDAIDTSNLKTSGKVVTGTNIIELSVTGADPEAVYALTLAMGEEVLTYIGQLDETFELAPLDEPRLPKTPVGPNTPLTVATGLFLGVLLAAGLTVGLEMLTTKPESKLSERDDEDTFAVVDESEFDELFRRQLGRARRDGTSFTVGLLTATRSGAISIGNAANVQSLEFDRLVRASMPIYRKNATILSLGHAKYGIIETELPPDEAEELMMVWLSVWKAAIEVAELFDGQEGTDVTVSVGVSTYGATDHPDTPDLRAVVS